MAKLWDRALTWGQLMIGWAGAYAADLITEEQRFDLVRHACPGPGACGGMYTANTMASAIEALGMSLPYSSSTPAEDPLKKLECRKAGLCAPLTLPFKQPWNNMFTHAVRPLAAWRHVIQSPCQWALHTLR